jgi:hypothetical protein
MDMTLGTWRVSIHRIPPTSAELAALYNHAAHYWQGAIRRLGFLRAYADLFARLQDDGALGSLQPGAWALDCGNRRDRHRPADARPGPARAGCGRSTSGSALR